MNYIDRIFMRADPQQICQFLLYGVEGRSDPRSCKKRVENAQKRVMERLREAYPDEKEYEEMSGLLFDCMGVVEEVTMEIGMQVGAVLVARVCQNLKIEEV